MSSLALNSRLLLIVALLGGLLILGVGIEQFWSASSHLSFSLNESSTPASIPKKIWQTWHTPAALLGDEDKARVRSWLEKNPEFRYELVTDTAAEGFVRYHFSNDPLLRDIFLGLNDTILKADFLRYLIVLAEGGVYADIDVECYQSIDSWLPKQLWDKAGGVVGIEADRKPVENDVKLYSDHRKHIWGINNWSFMAKPGHPFMRLVAESVARNLQSIAEEQNRTLSSIDLSYKQVIDFTGPRAFTAAFLGHASKVMGSNVTYADATMLEEPKIFDDIVVLPIRAMSTAEADRADGDGARSKAWPAVLFHWSVGSWKKTHFITPEPEPEG